MEGPVDEAIWSGSFGGQIWRILRELMSRRMTQNEEYEGRAGEAARSVLSREREDWKRIERLVALRLQG